MKQTINIAGAGLAGLTAAINLARAGYSVRIFEKNNSIGQQSKETIQLLPNWFSPKDVIEELEECGIKINWLNKIEEIQVFLDSTKKLIFRGQKVPMGYTVLRGGSNSFEKYLAEQAREVGVEIVLGSQARVKPIILATGNNKILTVGYGEVYQGDFDPTKVKVFLSSRFSPSIGYAYFFPHDQNIATLKISERVSENVNIKENLRKVRESYLSKEIKEENFIYSFGTKRSFSIPKTAILNGSLLVGEAAGFQDELFRFGMRYAIISGYLAAQSIINNLDYDKLWKQRFLPEFKRTSRTKKIFCFLKQKNFTFLPKNFRLQMKIENFKKIWLGLI